MSSEKVKCIYCKEQIFKRKWSQHLSTKKHKNVEEYDQFADVVEIPDWLFKKDSEYKLPKNYNKRYQIREFNQLPTSINIVITSKDDLGIQKIHGNEIVNKTLNKFIKINDTYRFKNQVIANCKFIKYDYEEMADDQILERKIATDMKTNQTQIQFEEDDHNIALILNQRAHNVELEGSGFDFQHIIELSIHMYLISDVKGKSYVKLPFTHQSVLNIKNNDNLCFLWCILACFHPVDSKNHSSRVSKYEPYSNELNVENIDLKDGMKIKGISKFEKQK